jgi:hypothetical protein
MKQVITSFFSGLLFAIGLGVAGMTQPSRVVAFLDVTGRWDPSLAFVMVGAIGVYALVHRLICARRASLGAPELHLPTPKRIDARLVAGAALFGIGWGLGGICPGPAITSLASGAPSILLFVLAMLAGMALHTAGAALRRPAAQQAPRAAAGD